MTAEVKPLWTPPTDLVTQQLRLECLKLAVSAEAKDVLKLAKEMEKWVSSK